MNLFSRIIRKLFLVKEIVSQMGKVHFRRYRLLSTPWFNIYIHHILSSDLDVDPHDHPFSFHSLILKGAYQELCKYEPYFDEGFHCCKHYAGQVVVHKAEDAHKITLLTPDVWTLVVTSGRTRDWGYRLSDGTWVQHQEYRRLKNSKEEEYV